MWSMSSAFCSAHPYDQKFPIAIIPHSAMSTEATRKHAHRTVAVVVAWSMQRAASGERPTQGPFGEAMGKRSGIEGPLLCGQWRGVYFGFRADEKARKEVHFFTRSYQHGCICINCFAQRPHKSWSPHLCYKILGRHAAHKLTQVSTLSKSTYILLIFFWVVVQSPHTTDFWFSKGNRHI